MAITAMGMETAAQSSAGLAIYDDVNQEHWASGYITALYRQGIVNGDENGNFNPENNVTYIETAKMIVNSLGYSVLAEDAGGYPSG